MRHCLKLLIACVLAMTALTAHAGLFDDLGAALGGGAKTATADTTPAQTTDNPTDSPNHNLAVTRTNNASSDKRIALVIGNSSYSNSPLKNPVNDAKDMAKKLRTLGFNVIERNNLKKEQIGGTLREFRSKLAPGAVALVFYAGHGLQIKGINYLPAVDADINSEEDVPNQSIAVNQIMDVLDESKTRLNLVFLDACRNNPYASRGFRSAERGLARVSAPSGTLISYATKPGSVAADGDGRNGLYTGKLLTQMDNNLQIEQTLKRVVTEVKAASQGKQEPWMEGSIEGDFCFGGCAASGGTQVASLIPVPTPVYIKSHEEIEQDAWESVRDSDNPNSIQEYLNQYPKGRFAGQAKIRIASLKPAPAQAAEPVPAQPARSKKSGEEIEDEYWDAIKNSSDLSGFEQYRKAYPKGRYLNTANLKIAQLKKQTPEPALVVASPAREDNETALWSEAQKGGTAEDYRAYLGQYPKGKYAVLAKGRLKKLDDEAAQQARQEREAAAQQAAQQEQSAWDSANGSASEAGYQSYLNSYPQGRYATLAQGRITNLKKQAAQAAANGPKIGQVFKDCADCPEMVVIPKGSFTMGSSKGGDESPAHSVTLSKPFALGKTEITQGQWRAVMGNNPSKFSNCGDNCPVEQVNWDDAQTFIQKLNQKTGKQYRLPSEAEWEYATRAGSTTAYPWGDQASHEYANYGTDACCAGLAQGRDQWVNTSPAGSFPANAFGLYDMNGNVWEWTEDSYHDSYNGAPADGTAWSGDGAKRVLRGGSWGNSPNFTRSAFRFNNSPASRNYFIGFRVVRTLP